MTARQSRGSVDARSLLQGTARDAVRLLCVQAAAIYLRPADAPEARWACDSGLRRGALRSGIRGLSGPVAGGIAPATAAWKALAPADSPLHLVLAAPMLGIDPSPRGVLCLFDVGGRRFTSLERILVRALTDRAALALESADLVRRLGEAEARHRFVLDRLPDVIWAAGADRIFTYVSAGSERLLGYLPDELIGKSSEIVMHESSRPAFEAGYRWQMAHPDGDQTYRVNLRHKDGHPVPVEVHNVGTPHGGAYGGGTGSVREMTERERLEREIKEQAAELAASRERARLAQELHDSVTQALFSITITAGAARMLLERNKPGVDAKLEELGALSRDALAEMRSLIFELRPGSLSEEGFATALRTHIAAVQARTGLNIRLDISPGLKCLPSSVEDALYRIAQEAIHNIVKHARAHEAGIQIRSQPKTVRMQVRDDGVGFDPGLRRDGIGIAGMAGRAERVGGSVSVKSAPGRGTVVTATLPTVGVDILDPEDRGHA